MDGEGTVIRRAEENDLSALGGLGALLMRTHFAFDAQRFMAPGAAPECGYSAFLRMQLREDDAIVLVAKRDATDEIVGYVYAGLEPRSWKELREPAGFIHDVVVVERERNRGIAAALLAAAIDWLRSRGAPRVLLWTAEPNAAAQRLFARLGFRRTMIEMTLEL
jgi:GNAT superfamily N-acetyltransferase